MKTVFLQTKFSNIKTQVRLYMRNCRYEVNFCFRNTLYSKRLGYRTTFMQKVDLDSSLVDDTSLDEMSPQ